MLHQSLHIGGAPVLDQLRIVRIRYHARILKPGSTVSKSSLLSLTAKKCWLPFTLSSLTQPSVLPSVVRGESRLPGAGQDGVDTCRTNPSPDSFQATMPFEWPQGALRESPLKD